MSAKTKPIVVEEFPELFNFTGDDNVHPISHEPMFVNILADLPGMDEVVARARAVDSTFVVVPVPGFSNVRDIAERILAGEQTDMDAILAADDEAERLDRRNRLSKALQVAARDMVDGEARRLISDNKRRIAGQITDLLQGTVKDAAGIVKRLGPVREFTDIERRPDLMPVWGEFTNQVAVFTKELKIAETFSRLQSAHDPAAFGLPEKRWPMAWLFDSYPDAWPEFYLAEGAEVDGTYVDEAKPWFDRLTPAELLRGIIDRNLTVKACTRDAHKARNVKTTQSAQYRLERWIENNGAPGEILPVFTNTNPRPAPPITEDPLAQPD